MRIGSISAEGLLAVVGIALALNLGVMHLTRDPGAAVGTAAAVPGRPTTPPLLVVVGGQGRADAEVGRSLAEARGAAVLALPADGPTPELTAELTAELARARPGQVLVLGGPAVVDEATVSTLRRLAPGAVTRLAGGNRFETAAQVATTQFPRPAERVRILSADEAGNVWPAPQRTRSDAPVLLVERDRIPPATAAALREVRPGSIDVAGGPGAVSDAVVQQLQGFTAGQVARLSG